MGINGILHITPDSIVTLLNVLGGCRLSHKQQVSKHQGHRIR